MRSEILLDKHEDFFLHELSMREKMTEEEKEDKRKRESNNIITAFRLGMKLRFSIVIDHFQLLCMRTHKEQRSKSDPPRRTSMHDYFLHVDEIISIHS